MLWFFWLSCMWIIEHGWVYMIYFVWVNSWLWPWLPMNIYLLVWCSIGTPLRLLYSYHRLLEFACGTSTTSFIVMGVQLIFAVSDHCLFIWHPRSLKFHYVIGFGGLACNGDCTILNELHDMTLSFVVLCKCNMFLCLLAWDSVFSLYSSFGVICSQN